MEWVSVSEREMVVEYWFRKLMALEMSIEDIIKIIVEFGNKYERFDESLVHNALTVDERQDIVSGYQDPEKDGDRYSAFGTIIADRDAKYHWMLQILEMGDESVNIGIIEQDEAEKNLEEYWWGEDFGYSYYQDGQIYCSSFFTGEDYGEALQCGDIVHIWLDLKENNDLSFCINDKQFGKAFDIDPGQYRLGVSLKKGKIKLILLEIEK